ncbi:MAG TPA: response regulator [Roseovarius sp.]|nr:response regulator [Roseovarius sp.]
MRILAIDDERLFCDLLKTRLADLGFTDFETAHSGAEALDRVAKEDHPFDCFLVDIRMVPMDGIEVVRKLRAIPHHQATPIIMISALTDKASVDSAFIAGANDFITKPLDSVELKLRLEMAKSILAERAQARLLHDRLLKQEATRFGSSGFDSEVFLDDVESAIRMVSMENFLLKEGNMRLRHSCAIGFHIPMAESYYRMLDPAYYADLLSDLALAISKALSGTPHMLVCPGKGDIVALLLNQTHTDQTRLEQTLDAELAKLRTRYDAIGMTLPSLRIGEPVRARFIPLQCPTTLISRARSTARDLDHRDDDFIQKAIA